MVPLHSGALEHELQTGCMATGDHIANVVAAEEAVSYLRLEITESQCDFEAIWLRRSLVSVRSVWPSDSAGFRTAVAMSKNIRGRPRPRQIRHESRACRTPRV
jgi:hypothetical protein